MPDDLYRETMQIVRLLVENPYLPEAKPLGRELTGYYTIYIDGWRLIFDIVPRDHLVRIWSIALRGPDTYINL